MVALGPVGVSTEKLQDALWPELEADAAHDALAAALRRVRELLACPAAIRQRNGTLSFDTRYVWIDTLAFEQACASHEAKCSPNVSVLFDLYQGPFLGEVIDTPWSAPARQRLRRRFVEAIRRLALSLESESRWAEALDCYQRAYGADPTLEVALRGIERCESELRRTCEDASNTLRPDGGKSI